MVLPVVGGVQRHGDEQSAVPLRRGHQAPARLFGKACLYPHAALVLGEELVMVCIGDALYRLRELHSQAGAGAQLAEGLVLQGGPGQQGHVVGGGEVAQPLGVLPVQARGRDKVGVRHAQGRGPLVHPGGERLQGAVQVEGGRVGGVVARGQQHPRRKACQGDAVPCLQTHGGALHRHHFLGDIHQGVAPLLGGLQARRAVMILVVLATGRGVWPSFSNRTVPASAVREHHSALGGNLRPCRPRHRAQRPHQARRERPRAAARFLQCFNTPNHPPRKNLCGRAKRYASNILGDRLHRLGRGLGQRLLLPVLFSGTGR